MAAPPKPVRRLTLIGNHPVTTASTMLDLYEPMDVIGSGSFGIIRTVKRKADGAILARKELNWRKMDERDLRQLNEEVNILQNMPPNEYIVQYHERFLDKSNCMLHIVMEYCENGDLTHVIQRCRQDNLLLPEEVIWSYLTQITLALADCHADTDAQGRKKTVVLHRDLKPENVFLSKDNILKLGDFGLSKAMSANFTNTYVGTPYYMSPELINGQQYDVKSDIWALGCLIYELCAWHPPFSQAQTQPELAKMIRDGKIPSLPQGYSVMLNQVVKSMLRQDPKQRPTTKQIMTLDQVKLQMRALDLRRFKNTLLREKEAVAKDKLALVERSNLLSEREQAVAEREGAMLELEQSLLDREAALTEREQQLASTDHRDQALSERERFLDSEEQRVQQERDLWMQEKGRLAQALGISPTLIQHRPSSSASTDGRASMKSSYGYEEGESYQRENSRMPSMGSIALALPNMGDKADAAIRRVASRPSLVPRPPLEERRTTSQISRRVSTQSLMSVDDTPIKSPIYASQQYYIHRSSTQQNVPPNERSCPPSSENRRRMIASKSMYNLNTQQKLPTARQLFHSSSKDSLRSIPSLESQKSPLSAHSVYSFFPPRSEDSSPLSNDETSASCPASPTKRTAAVAFASTRSNSQDRMSTAPPAIPLPQVQRPSAIGRTATAPPAIPKYNLEDEDSLPSPFIKKKPSILNLGGGKSASRTNSVPTSTRTLRPSTSRHSLLSAKTVVGRAMKSASTLTDEQGRLVSDKRTAASTLS